MIYYDQCGCGQSDYHPGAGYTPAQAVDDLGQLRAALRLDRWAVLGWSYGGAVALVWQGHLLDLPDQHRQAVALYHKAAATTLRMEHDQYGLVLTRDYVQERIRIAFKRTANQRDD